jgi:2C-methyl-D-erythritol 2,4-cyclodiphosphate synthase
MRARLSDAVGPPLTVKARRGEGLCANGRGEGVACFAVALVEAG